ncbi:MAG: tetratricopeptide repeat protein [Candidatus Competibacteraceae bacterium]|jgi:tetratricopeptide (TPR) repeat protein|nr:tetratricopeptide repeat protein [Candidatus Competibacteraceae bacterium]
MLSSFLLIVLVVLVPTTTAFASTPEYVGSKQCASCHENEMKDWQGSHHDLAMAEATEDTVLGDFDDVEFTAHGVTSRFFRKDGKFFVRTDGPDGTLQDYPIRYTFGWYPLQQYLIEFPRGHFQSLGLAWDSRPAEQDGQRWFHLYPNEEGMDHTDPLHWTSREQTWNYQCAECHSTNLQKNYDLASDSYKTSWNEINVACEACHGPGSAHLAWAEQAETVSETAETVKNKGLVVDLADSDGGQWVIDEKTGEPRRTTPRLQHTKIELCARCHSRRGQIWQDYTFGKPLLDTHRLALLDERLYFPDGQIKDEVYVYGSFIQSKMYMAGVTCSDCHEPHSLKLRAEGNAICARCHLPSRYDTPVHHHHEQDTPGAACTSCHMPERPYMVNDYRADHSMRVPRPDLTLSIDSPNACNACHTDQTPQWAQAAVSEWYPDSDYRGKHFGYALHAARTDDPNVGISLLAVAEDKTQPGIARATALDHLAERPRGEYLPAISKLLQDDDPLVRSAAVRFLEQTDVRTQVDQGWLMLEDPVRTVRLDAISLLAPLTRQRLPEKYRTQLEERIEEYKTAQLVNAERPEANLNLGVLAANLGQPVEAEAAYNRALRLDPSFTPAYINLADLYRQTGRDADGEQVLRQGITATPQNPDLYFSLGLLQVRSEQLDGAIDSLSQAAELAPEQTHYLYVYALALDKAGKHEKTIQTLQTVLDREPAHRDAAITLANIHLQRSDEDSARKVLDEIKQQLPQDPQIQAFEQQLSNPTGRPQ